ncbi:hypothetical protein V0288_17260 [Pannus brasiliensis CCIBt3594]|uniref:Uncharacterized protein n=1 Tax=Pannus brasiliensis CCIBt3594 TaxID=1427578 RepID=A0AAW9QUB0_9CHRO
MAIGYQRSALPHTGEDFAGETGRSNFPRKFRHLLLRQESGARSQESGGERRSKEAFKNINTRFHR